MSGAVTNYLSKRSKKFELLRSECIPNTNEIQSYSSSEKEADPDEDEDDHENDDKSNSVEIRRTAPASFPHRTSRRVKPNKVANAVWDDEEILFEADKQFQKLFDEVNLQRRAIPAEDLDLFDSTWGLDPLGNFFKARRHSRPLLFSSNNTKDSGILIKEELLHVASMTSDKIAQLSRATQTHRGLEILNLFILDLLGRNTAAARIFDNKSSEDFRHAKVVTLLMRVAGPDRFEQFLHVLLHSPLFATGQGLAERLRGELPDSNHSRNCHWRDLGVFVGEPFRPFAGEGRYREGVSQPAGRDQQPMLFPVLQNQILFECSRLFVHLHERRKRVPTMLESMIVLSYSNHLPGELSQKWNSVSNHNNNYHNQNSNPSARSSSRPTILFRSVLPLLQLIGALPNLVHWNFARSFQPLFSSALSSYSFVTACVIEQSHGWGRRNLSYSCLLWSKVGSVLKDLETIASNRPSISHSRSDSINTNTCSIYSFPTIFPSYCYFR